MITVFTFLKNLRFYLPKKEKILIFDRYSHCLIDIFNIKKFFILDARKESFYIFFFFWKIIKILKNKNLTLYQSYLIEIIKFIKPKIILNFIDNNFFCFLIKNYLNFDCKLLIFQNGIRRNYEFNFPKDSNIDYFFCFGKNKKFHKKIQQKKIIIGSVKNNFFKLHKPVKKKVITFISNYRKEEDFYINTKNWSKFYESFKIKYKKEYLNNFSYYEDYKKYFNMFYFTEKKLIPIIAEYCKKKNFKLEILVTFDNNSIDSDREVDFYEKLIKNNFKNYKFLTRKNWKSSYLNLNKKNILICVDSTLGLEALRQKLKVFFFTRNTLFGRTNIIGKNFPNLKERIWSNKINRKNVFKTLDRLYALSNEKWKVFFDKKIMFRFSYLEYDFKNKKVKKIIQEALNKA